MIISGKECSAKVKDQVAAQVAALKAEGRRIPALSVILVGDNPASQSYVKSKARACEAVGMENRTIVLPADTTQSQLEAAVEQENSNPAVDGILVQLPLPKGLDEKAVIEKISWDKDVDGLHPMNVGKLFSGQEGFIPCTPKGILFMLDQVLPHDLSGKKAVVMGRSNLVGKPVAQLLMNRNATVTIIHSRTENPQQITSQADILVAAIGQPEYVREDWIKPGAVVIDVGINRTPQGLKGDVDFAACCPKAGAITPVPGGVGLMTVAMLLENTLEAYQLHERKNNL